MHRSARLVVAACALVLTAAAHSQSDLAALPPILRTVNDEAGVLSDEQGIRLTRRLIDILEQTGVRIVVVTVPTVGSEPIEDYADRLAPRWARERRVDPNEMIIVVVAIRDRYMVARPGKGLPLASKIDARELMSVVGPLFSKGSYYDGLLALTDRMHAVIEENAPSRAKGR